MKPLDEELVLEHLKRTKWIITIEDGIRSGGFATQIRELLISENIKRYNLLTLGVPEETIEVASREELLEKYHLNTEGICQELRRFFKKKRSNIFKF